MLEELSSPQNCLAYFSKYIGVSNSMVHSTEVFGFWNVCRLQYCEETKKKKPTIKYIKCGTAIKLFWIHGTMKENLVGCCASYSSYLVRTMLPFINWQTIFQASIDCVNGIHQPNTSRAKNSVLAARTLMTVENECKNRWQNDAALSVALISGKQQGEKEEEGGGIVYLNFEVLLCNWLINALLGKWLA